MASFPITLRALPPVTPPLNVGPVAAAAPVALVAAEADALPLPFAQSPAAPAPPAATAGAAQDGAAMRPDQVLMARQLVFPAADGRALASTWRSMVRTYGAELANREQQARAGQLSPALLAAAQDGGVSRPLDGLGHPPPDAWRFTVHAGSPQAHHLQVLADDDAQQQGRRRRGAGLRLELELADGTHVMVLAEAVPGGVALELWAPDASTLERLRELQPALEAAIGRAGVRVLRWKFLHRLPAGQVHAAMPMAEAANALSLPVFRAMAELALLLPAAPASAAGLSA
ncbi:MAG: hypothetical protein ACJ8LG_20620 [Massilia sp.]